MFQTIVLILLAFLVDLSFSTRFHPRDLKAPLADCYDYIIVGGGISGLVVANRLTENPDVTVLVLEAGDLDNYEDVILYPIENGQGLGSKYDWNLWTAPQIHLDGAPRPYDLGRGVGGGSLINGMCWTRGGSADFDAWEALGNPGWGWDDLLPYFKKSENFTNNVDAEHRRDLHIKSDPFVHGTDGYVKVSYPRYFYSQSQLFLEGLQELGIPILTEPNNGTTTGGMLIPNSLSPDNQTRSTTRLGYYDRFIDNRPNFHIATGQHVIRLLTNRQGNILPRDSPAGLWIIGVEFISDGSMTVRNVTCRREVVLAAGNVHTPQILELSGIGQADVLSKFNIPVVLNLPGVGNNFQDHPYVGVIYYYNNASYFNINKMYYDPDLYAQLAQHYYVNKTGPWTSGAINTVAFPSLQSISQNWTNMVADGASQDTTQYLLPNLDSTILEGYAAQKKILVEFLRREDVSAYEILNNNRWIDSTNPFIQPLIDPRYCSNPLDCQVLVEGLLFNNKLINTTAMRVLQPTGYDPFLPNATPETLMPAINSGLRTEFHGSGATSMMPLELGGVVDTHLRVYGTKNLRIVDAGIMPLVPASHLQAPVYAIAEKAADIIKADNKGLIAQGCGVNSVFAVPGQVLSNLTKNTPIVSSASSSSISSSVVSSFVKSSSSGLPSFLSSSPPRPTGSTFAQLMNLSDWSLLNFTRKPVPTIPVSRFLFAAGAVPAEKATSAKIDAILKVASIFLESNSAPSPGLSKTIDKEVKPVEPVKDGQPSSARFRLDTSLPTISLSNPVILSPHLSSSGVIRNAAGLIMHQVDNIFTSTTTPKTPKALTAPQPIVLPPTLIGAAASIATNFRIHKVLFVEADRD